MGDKGGKKDKEKNKQQQLTKHKQEEQKKHDKAPAKNFVTARVTEAVVGPRDHPLHSLV